VADEAFPEEDEDMTETAEKREFMNGDRAWTRDGVKVIVQAETTRGEYLVAPLLDIGCYDPEFGPPDEASGPFVLVDELYNEPPRQFTDAQMAKAKEAVAEAVEELSRIQSDIRDATAERARLVTKLKDVPALQHIERMLEGKMRFVVTEMYGDMKVMTIDEAQRENSRFNGDRRLITLKTGKEGTYWAINTWSDGSGADFKIWFFETIEKAKSYAIQLAGDRLAVAFERYSRSDRDANEYASSLVSCASKVSALGGVIPMVVAAVLNDAKRKNLRQTIEANQKHASSYHAAIEQAQAELRALDGEQVS